MSEKIRENADYAIESFKEAHEAYKATRHHPNTRLEQELAEGRVMNERLKSVQQMSMIVQTQDDMDWREILEAHNE